ncbi:MAG: KEOPS complex subunit Pcc1 [Candidatus Nezhaarchaeales archaeon]
MRLNIEVKITLRSADLALSAARALEVDNRQSPKDVVVTCRAKGDELVINVVCEKPLRALSTIEDVFICLVPLMKLENMLEIKEG